MREGFVQVNGVRTRYVAEGSGPPIVLLHGFHGFAEHWRWAVPYLRGRTCYAVDLLGHGKTDKPLAGYGLDDFGSHLVGVLDELAIPSAALVGNSLGGAVALWAAVHAPDRVDRIVLVCPAGLHATTRLGAIQFVLGTVEAGARVRTRYVANFSKRLQFADPDGIDPDFFRLKEADARARRKDPAFRRATLSQSRAIARFRGIELERVRHPVLVLWGAEDRMLSWERAVPAIERLPDGRLEVLHRCGHLPHVECPERFADAVLGFLEHQTG